MPAPPISTDPHGTAAFFRHVLAGAVLLNMLVVGMAAVALDRSRVQYEEAAAATTRNLALVLEQYLAASIDRIDAVLIDVAEETEHRLAAGRFDVPAVQALVERHGKRHPGLGGLRVADAAGNVLDGKADFGAPPVSVAVQRYFVRVRDDARAGLVFSESFSESRTMPGGDDPVIVVSRRITAADGSFGGAVCARLLPERFNRFFAAIDLGTDGTIGLRDSRLQPIARYPRQPGGAAPVPPELQALVAGGHSSGTYFTTRTADRIARTVSYRKVADYPFYVLVGVAADGYLAKWWREVVQLSALAAFFALVSGSLAWVFYHLWKIRLMAAERAAQLHALAMELSVAEERERYSIAQDLHDDLGQTLAIAKLRLTALAPAPAQGDARREPEMAEIRQIEALIDEANRSVRSLTQQLSPPILHQFGLVPALQWLAEEMQRAYGLTVTIQDDGTRKVFGDSAASMLFRAVRELLVNVARHAGVAAAEVKIATEADRLVIAVSDRGCGFDASRGSKPAATGGYGLFSVRERMEFIGGEMRVDSRPGAGTVVSLSISPQAAAEEDGK